MPAFAMLSGLEDLPGLPRFEEMDVAYGQDLE